MGRKHGAERIAWPVGTAGWEARAAEVLPPAVHDWLAGGAGEEWTLRANRSAFERWRLRPRMLTGNDRRDASVTVAGTRCPAPFLLAPIGGQTLVHPEGELATAGAVSATGVPLIVSTASSFGIEEIASQMGGVPFWYQLYWVDDRDVVESFVDRAVASGCAAIVLTVDTPLMGSRDRDVRNDFAPARHGAGLGMYASDDAFARRLTRPPEEDPEAVREEVARITPHTHLTWTDLGWLRAKTTLPLLAKGVLTAEDAIAALDAGMDGVIVSNHGGRQLDGAVASLDALIEVRAALGDDATVLMDGGVRRGTDVVKAVAAGANAVLVGRPFMYGLAIAGRDGVEAVLGSLIDDIDRTFALVGARDVGSIGRSFIVEAPG